MFLAGKRITIFQLKIHKKMFLATELWARAHYRD